MFSCAHWDDRCGLSSFLKCGWEIGSWPGMQQATQTGDRHKLHNSFPLFCVINCQLHAKLPPASLHTCDFAPKKKSDTGLPLLPPKKSISVTFLMSSSPAHDVFALRETLSISTTSFRPSFLGFHHIYLKIVSPLTSKKPNKLFLLKQTVCDIFKVNSKLLLSFYIQAAPQQEEHTHLNRFFRIRQRAAF